jgi:hypothetical protein
MTPARPRAASPEVPDISTANCDTFIGVDPGVDGGIAVLSISPQLPAHAFVTPTVKTAKGRRRIDRVRAWAILASFPDAFIAIEAVNAAPMRGRVQGTTSMFNFGCDFGVWLGIITALRRPYVEVDPKKWKAAILAGTKRDKDAAIEYAKRFYPSVSLRATPRCKTDHTGIADAVCLAEYARQAWKVRELLSTRP